jgi:hypothetical protein
MRDGCYESAPAQAYRRQELTVVDLRQQRGPICLLPDAMPSDEHQPGDPTPHSGHYEELNIFGSPTAGCAMFAKASRSLMPRVALPGDAMVDLATTARLTS